MPAPLAKYRETHDLLIFGNELAMTPEEKAREPVDAMLTASGGAVTA
jgi:hypothetical protein